MDELGNVDEWKRRGFSIVEPRAEEVKLNNAIRALFILYRRGKWDMLARYGITKERHLDNLRTFDLLKFKGSDDVVKSEGDTILLTKFVPGIIAAATQLVNDYKQLEREKKQ